MDTEELAARRALFEGFAATGRPPAGIEPGLVRRLAERHVVVLEEGSGAIVMAHPFAAPPGGAEVRAGDRRWWGNCAWDALGIVAALGLREATIVAGDVEIEVRDGRPVDDGLLFHVAVPAAAWWDDIAFT